MNITFVEPNMHGLLRRLTARTATTPIFGVRPLDVRALGGDKGEMLVGEMLTYLYDLGFRMVEIGKGCITPSQENRCTVVSSFFRPERCQAQWQQRGRGVGGVSHA